LPGLPKFDDLFVRGIVDGTIGSSKRRTAVGLAGLGLLKGKDDALVRQQRFGEAAFE